LLTAGGAVLVNSVAAWVLAGVRAHGGSVSHAAWVAARNDVAINLAVIVMAGMTVVADSGWPDLVLGVIIVVVNAWAAVREVWKLAEEERLAAKAVAGEPFD
jgi:Co/Zn/Cd efflux system component